MLLGALEWVHRIRSNSIFRWQVSGRPKASTICIRISGRLLIEKLIEPTCLYLTHLGEPLYVWPCSLQAPQSVRSGDVEWWQRRHAQ